MAAPGFFPRPAPLEWSGELAELILRQTPFIDVRAPEEFVTGSAPGAINLPLLDDEQRAAVGTEYKHQGQESAVALGQRLVGGELREARLDAWEKFARAHPEAWIYCFRGGLRSQLVRSTLRAERGLDLPLVEGGYKRLRGFFMSALERLSATESFVVISGFTGAGKTQFLRALRHCDLEALAHHRGSAFGKTPVAQPSQADFENRLAAALIALNAGSAIGAIALEDESRTIGKIVLPRTLFERMSNAPLVVIESPLEERAERLIATYLTENYGLLDGRAAAGDDDPVFARLTRDLEGNLAAIAPRLGGADAKAFSDMIHGALTSHRESGRFAPHQEWVARLLERYYDPVYNRHLEREHSRIAFRGSADEALEYLGVLNQRAMLT